jgi:hypothetical protein
MVDRDDEITYECWCGCGPVSLDELLGILLLRRPYVEQIRRTLPSHRAADLSLDAVVHAPIDTAHFRRVFARIGLVNGVVAQAAATCLAFATYQDWPLADRSTAPLVIADYIFLDRHSKRWRLAAGGELDLDRLRVPSDLALFLTMDRPKAAEAWLRRTYERTLLPVALPPGAFSDEPAAPIVEEATFPARRPFRVVRRSGRREPVEATLGNRYAVAFIAAWNVLYLCGSGSYSEEEMQAQARSCAVQATALLLRRSARSSEASELAKEAQRLAIKLVFAGWRSEPGHEARALQISRVVASVVRSSISIRDAFEVLEEALSGMDAYSIAAMVHRIVRKSSWREVATMTHLTEQETRDFVRDALAELRARLVDVASGWA